MLARWRAWRRRRESERRIRRTLKSIERYEMRTKRTITLIIPIWVWAPILGLLLYLVFH